MANIVITGSTRGIGLGLAKEFRKRGHSVMISSRGKEAVERAIAEVSALPGEGGVHGQPCDVSKGEDVAALWDAAASAMGEVDIWINNAGMSGPRKDVIYLRTDEIAPVVDTNIWGMIHGTQVPLRQMLETNSGKIFNFEGLGSDGVAVPGLSIYTMTKCALRNFTKAVNKEIAGKGVIVGTISPGIVVTDLLEDSRDDDPVRAERAKKIYNILGDKVETVAPFIVEEVLAAEKPYPKIKWMTGGKAAWRFATARFTKREIM